MSNLLAAADAVATLNQAPKTQTGRMLPQLGAPAPGLPGWDVIAAQAQQIDVPELRWPVSVRTYEQMRRDSQIQGLLTSVFLPIRHMEWFVDPGDSPDGCAQEIATDLGLPLLGDPPVNDGIGIDFDDHLRLALLALAYGHQFFEEAGDIVGTGNGMRYRLRSLMQYPQPTIARINVNSDGTLRSLQQNTVAEWPEVAADRLLSYVWDKEGANWAGRPLLVGIYKNWLAKDSLVRSNVVAIRRFSGVPIAKATVPDVGAKAGQEAALMAQMLQSGDGSGAFLPYGTDMDILGVKGSLPDAISAIRYHDEQMARAFMQMFAELGKTASGSRALGTTLLDHYALGVLAVAKWVRKSTAVLVRRIVDRNYGPDAAAPTLGFRADDHEDITIADLVAAIDANLIVVDDDLEATVRDRANLPPRNTTEPGRTAGPAQVSTNLRPVAAAAPDVPAPVDQAAVDMAALQAAYSTAVARLKRQWTDVQARQIEDLVAQVERAPDITAMARIATSAQGADVLASELAEVLADGAAAAHAEALAQGHTLAAGSMDAAHTAVRQTAEATAELLAGSLSESAASKATALAGGGLTQSEIAAQVRDHLTGLAGSTVDYELAGAVTKAQNTGRFTVMAGAPDGTRIISSELNDSHVCELCAAEDGAEFPNVQEALRDYPGYGGFVGCLGGKRCRGTLVAIYPEAT